MRFQPQLQRHRKTRDDNISSFYSNSGATGFYLQMCRSLKGFVADTTHVAAVFAVSLSTVAAECVGVLAHLITVVTLVAVLSFHGTTLPALVAIDCHLDCTRKTTMTKRPFIVTEPTNLTLTLYVLSDAPFADWECWLTSMTCWLEAAACPTSVDSFSTAGNV